MAPERKALSEAEDYAGSEGWMLGDTPAEVGAASRGQRTLHNRHPGSNGLCFQAVHDCWADDVRVVNCDLGFGFTATKAVTLTNVDPSGLPRDFEGDLENGTYLLGTRPAVSDLYTAQRRVR